MITGIGSSVSLILHTMLFTVFFLLPLLGIASWSVMLLVLTTIVSLEAIYLAIFIQMTVNKQARELAEVSEDVEDIQEDIGEIQEDVGEIQEDVKEINEEDETEELLENQRVDALKQLTRDVQRVLVDLEHLKKR